MPDHRKPPIHKSSRPQGVLPDADSEGFSIESTTMRLKSMKLRRAENELKELKRAEANVKSKPSDSLESPAGRPSGRVRHDERGMAVWDWAVASGELDSLSQTGALKKLGVADLKIEDSESSGLQLENTGRDKGGGFDPYNQRGIGKRPGGTGTANLGKKK